MNYKDASIDSSLAYFSPDTALPTSVFGLEVRLMPLFIQQHVNLLRGGPSMVKPLQHYLGAQSEAAST